MSHYPAAKYLTSAASPDQLVPDDGAEVAFVGRSNAGKSSAINAIVNRRQFARTSKTPGRTQLINFFELADQRRLVDLPGYGFAKVPASVKAGWDHLIVGYLRGRISLRGIFLIVDVRRGLNDGDRQVIDLARSFDQPVHVLLNKADKLKRGQAIKARAAAERETKGVAGIQLFSALNREGLEEARERLEAFLASRPASGGLG